MSVTLAAPQPGVVTFITFGPLQPGVINFKIKLWLCNQPKSTVGKSRPQHSGARPAKQMNSYIGRKRHGASEYPDTGMIG